MSYPKTTKEYKDMLFTALHEKTFYKNQYPYNLGYYHSSGYFSFDCVNLVKAILNGWKPNKVVGYFQSSLGRTGDCTELGLINQCSNVSTDFNSIPDPAVLYMDGHIGNYVGEFVEEGKTYNVIECTGAFGGGVVHSYVTSNGVRYSCKGGSKNGRWEKHGKMDKWLKYEKEKPIDYVKVLRIATKIERGDYGNNPERKEKIIKKYGETYYNLAQRAVNSIH